MPVFHFAASLAATLRVEAPDEATARAWIDQIIAESAIGIDRKEGRNMSIGVSLYDDEKPELLTD